MRASLAICFAVLVLCCKALPLRATEATLDVAHIRHTAISAPSLLLDEAERISVATAFLDLVRIKGVSGEEGVVREEVKRRMLAAGATELSLKNGLPGAPLNLVMEIPATRAPASQPAILLNAHLDTVVWSTPEHLAFDSASGDFFHHHESVSGGTSSFGGDDRSGVAVLVEAIRILQTRYWKAGLSHRRIILVFTADEERGCVGAKHLARHHPESFENIDVSLTVDGPLDFRSNYPRDRLVAVLSKQHETELPYKRVLDLVRDFSDRTGIGFGKTEIGRGMGDFAHFPKSARAELHLRSPVRGFHNKERVNVGDLINHVDVMCFLLLGWDHPLPSTLSPETMLPSPVKSADR